MPSVDNRVVQMRFDNKDFEEDIGTSIASLDQLKKSLKLKDATEGFNEVEKAANSLSSKLTALGTIGDQILRNFANELYGLKNKFTALVKSMSIDQMNAGWDKYAQKTSAVKTIMSATADQFANEAEQMAEVNKQLDKLNWFTDETSYRLTDMTENIGKFTNQGMDLEKSVRAMQGIATWAGLSGANVNEASRAMYNLSQALGVGAVTLIDWKSIVNANMATKEFKEMAMEMAVTEKTLTKVKDGVYKTLSGTEVTLQNFNNTLSDRWFSDKVLMGTLEKFGGFSEELANVINKIWDENASITTSEYLKYLAEFKENSEMDLTSLAKKTHQSVEELRADLQHLSKAEYDLGYRAFVASQQAKTFQEAIDATKDAVSSKWLRTFEIVFGTYDKARELWTKVSEELWNVFALGINQRNEVLEIWASEARGGYAVLWRSISDLWTGLKKIGARSWDIWHAIFPELTVNNLLHATYKLSEFAYKFKHQILDLVFTSEELSDKGEGVKDWVQDFATVMTSLRSAIELVLHILGELGKFVGIPALKKMLDVFKWGLSVIAPFSEKFTEFVKEVKKSKVINKGLTAISDWFKELKKNLEGQENFKLFLENWQEFTSWLSGIKESALNNITNFINNLGNMELQLPRIQKISTFLNTIFGYINKLIDFSKRIPDAWDAIKNFFAGLDFSGIENFGASAASLISNFFQNLFSDEELEGTGRRWIRSLWKGISTEAGEIDGQKLFDTIIKALEVGVGAKLGLALSSFFSGISRIPLTAITVMDGVKDVLTSFAKTLRAAAFLQIAIGVLAIAGAMRILSKIPYDDLANVAVSMSLVLGVIALIVNGVSGILGAKAGVGQGNKFKTGAITGIRRLTVRFATLGPALIGFAAALGVVVYAILTLKDITEPVRQSSIKTIIGIAAILTAVIFIMSVIVNRSKALSNEGDDAKVFRFGLRLLSMAVAMILVASALKIVVDALSDVVKLITDSWDNPNIVAQALASLGIILAALGAMIGLVLLPAGNKTSLKSIIVIATMVGAFYLLMKPLTDFLKAISEMDYLDWKQLVAIMLGISAVMFAFGSVIAMIVSASNKTASTSNFSSFAFLTGIALAIAAFAGAIYLLKDIDWSGLKDGIGQLALFVTAITILGFITGSADKLGKGLTTLSTAIIAFGAAIALAGAGTLAFVKALELWKKISPTLKGTGKILGQEVAGFIDGLSGVTDKLLAFAGKLVTIIISAIIAKKSNITQLGADIVKSFADRIIKSKGVLIAALAILVAGILEYFDINVSTIVDALVKIIINIIVSLSMAIINNSGAIWKACLMLVNAIAFLLADMVLMINKAIVDAFPEDSPIGRWLRADYNETAKKINDWKNQLLTEMNAASSELSAGIRNDLDEVKGAFNGESELKLYDPSTELSKYKSVNVHIGTEPIKDVQISSEEAEKAVKEFDQSMTDTLTTIDPFARLLKYYLDDISLSWKGYIEGNKDAQQSLTERTLNEFGSGSWLFGPIGTLVYKIIHAGDDLGVDFADGVASGIYKGTRVVENAANDMVDAADKSARYHSRTHSPSLVFAEIGGFLALGLAQGMQQNTYLVEDAAGDIITDTIDVCSDIISNISSAMDGDLVFDPTIRPVLDLSEIQNGSARLNSIWGGYSFSPDMSFGLDRARSVTAAAADINMNQSSLSEAMLQMQADIALMRENNAVMAGVIDRYMPYIPEIANMDMTLDDDTLVGKLTPKIDKELGSIASRGRRTRF